MLRAMPFRTVVSILSALLFTPGCLVVDSGPLDRLRAAGDASVDVPSAPEDAPADGGTGGPSDRCADETAELLTGTSIHEIDTTTFGADFDLMGEPTDGNDAFFRFNGTSGQFWHFHLASLSPGRNPVLYVVRSSGGICMSSTMSVRNACTTTDGDEHFAFVVPATAEYFLGIDDSNTGGGRYRLQVIRPVCGDGLQEHGESCDGGPTGSDVCDTSCRILLSDLDGTGQTSVPIGRHNDTSAEAMVVVLDDADPTLDINGTIPPGDCYPDVFSLDVAANTRVSVTARNSTTGVACAAAADATYSLELKNAADTRIAGGVDGMGCPVVNQMLTNEGRYFIWLTNTGDGTRPLSYTLRFERTP